MQFVLDHLRRLKSAANTAPHVSVEVEPPDPPSREELRALVQSFPYWYQRIYLGRGIYTLDRTAHHEKVWERVRKTFPSDLGGASVLDVGANAGYFSIQSKLLGAGRVVGLESYGDYLKQAEVCRQIWGMDIEYRAANVDRMSELGEQFDIVLFLGILYHLKAPLLVLEDVGQACRDAIVIETEVMPARARNRVYVRLGPRDQTRITRCAEGMMKFIERDELGSDGSNWWVPDTECVLGMLRTAGFKHFSAPRYLGKERLMLIASKRSDSILNLQALE